MSNITGHQSGQLTALRLFGRNKWGQRVWLVRCACGKHKKLTPREFLQNRSCGCTKSALCKAAATIHGASKTKLYGTWLRIRNRCYLKSDKAWKNYGGRGITVCKKWNNSFSAFAADMGPSYKTGLTIERVNNNKGYSPSNCAWIPLPAQARNRRSTRWLQSPWGTLTAAECAGRLGINRGAMCRRMQNWPKKRWFEKPRKRKTKCP